MTRLAIVALSCRLPDAATPERLWDNLIEGRRSFRPLPSHRLELARYAAARVGEADSITAVRAGLLVDWTFDRARFRIAKSTFAATDLTHWLALDLAAEAVDACGGRDRLDPERTAVVVANTLTGEFSRTATLRHRLPFLDDLLARALAEEAVGDDAAERVRAAFADHIRARLPAPNDDSLAGGLANTIAGRVANYFDFKGGAFTVDGACASSLIAVTDAAQMLADGRVDTVLVGAVDLSLDPFELVGFSRNGALARRMMRVFDARAEGFWPGEGGAFAVLLREDEARRRDLPVRAVVRGCGLATDGAGGLTRPSVDGQRLAVQRAHASAGSDPRDLAFVEAHGTGTEIGDPTEIRALASVVDGRSGRLPVGSLKANIGHLKAAAGMAGVVKAVLALERDALPPHVGCDIPHPVFAAEGAGLEPALAPVDLTAAPARLAGVSSFGFGGINAHVVLEGAARVRKGAAPVVRPIAQDPELFVMAGPEPSRLIAAIDRLSTCAPTLSMAEMADAAATLASVPGEGRFRAGFIARDPAELTDRLARVRRALTAGTEIDDAEAGVFVGDREVPPRIGLLFPGQAAPVYADGGAWRRRFGDPAADVEVPPGRDPVATEFAQPIITASNLMGVQRLHALGLEGSVAVGHSLGEVAALAWAGSLGPADALGFAAARGRAMAAFGRTGGSMLRVAAPEATGSLARSDDVVVACVNAPREHVLAGPADALDRLARDFADRGIECAPLAVSHAFHSPDMAAVTSPLRTVVDALAIRDPARPVISTVSAHRLEDAGEIAARLVDQLTSPVLFVAALDAAARHGDVFVEVGPGEGLSRLAVASGYTCWSVDAGGPSLAPLLRTVAALYAAGAAVRPHALYADRVVRKFEPTVPVLLSNPCGSSAERRDDTPSPAAPAAPVAPDEPLDALTTGDPLAVVTAIVAADIGLPVDSIGPDDRFLDALHLSSLAVSRIVAAAARRLGVRTPAAPLEFASATPRAVAEALSEFAALPGGDTPVRVVEGVRPWVATYAMTWRAVPPVEPPTPASPPPAASADAATTAVVDVAGPWTRQTASDLIETAREAAGRGRRHLRLIHRGAPLAAFARSVVLEHSFETVEVVDLDDADASVWSAVPSSGYTERRLDGGGRWLEPVFVPVEPACEPAAVPRSDDVVVVVGGGRGIAAACALELAREVAAVVLVGRSSPDEADVARTLTTAAELGTVCRYARADATDRTALAEAVAAATRDLAAPTVLVHAAGLNEPSRLAGLDPATVEACLITKMDAFDHAIAACGPALRRVVTFGSIIGRIGLEGEAHYALANASQSAMAEAWAAAAPGRTALSLEWSVWGGTGMGERLGTIDRLVAAGVAPISVDDALAAFNRLVKSGAIGTVAVTSRFGPPPGLELDAKPAGSWRFVDRPLVHFPEVERIVETELSLGRDPYLADHRVEGDAVMPGVMALEAMAQVSAALSDLGAIAAIDDVRFLRPVVVADGERAPIRLCALATDGAVEAVVRGADDDFAMPAATARFRTAVTGRACPPLTVAPTSRAAAFDAHALYGPLLFHRGRFARLRRVRHLTSRSLVAELDPPTDGSPWFAMLEPQGLRLGDPGAADACLHALQAMIPHRRLLPVSIGAIERHRAGTPTGLKAVERATADGDYAFDLDLLDAEGVVLQCWRKASFRAVAELDPAPVLAAAPGLAGVYVERAARDALGVDELAVAVVADADADRTRRRARALRQLGLESRVHRRPDGRPVRRDGGGTVSIAHTTELTVVVVAAGEVGCDVEPGVADAETCRHLAVEACRKLGRRVSPDAGHSFRPDGRACHLAGARLALLPLPCGDRAVTIAVAVPETTTSEVLSR